MTVQNAAFTPGLGLRSPHVQSMLNSSAIRRKTVMKRTAALIAAEQEWLLDGGDGVRLLGHYSPQTVKRRKDNGQRRLAVLFHGWEGSSRSNYILSTSAHLYALGFDVFRLNFRDHGETHHLNKGLFHSCRLDEVIHALQDMQARTGASDWGLAGFSLGGNFTLRVANRAKADGLSIASAVAICPVIDPANTLNAMEQGPRFYHSYYVRKWTRSLNAKEVAFPGVYDVEAWKQLAGLRERTNFLAVRYAGYETGRAYLDGYSVAGDRLADLSVPSLILTAADDPVIPVSDIRALAGNPALEIHVTDHGGHCGFLKNWKFESWSEEVIADRFMAIGDGFNPSPAGEEND
jgi:predicted alpha/beta-fold hydrolase